MHGNTNHEGNSDALLVKKQTGKRHYTANKENQEWRKGNKTSNNNKNKETFKYKCHRCRKVGHKAVDCTERAKNTDNASTAEDLSLCATTNFSSAKEVDKRNIRTNISHKWCIDSGCTAHMCGGIEGFMNLNEATSGKINLASKVSTDIKRRGSMSLTADVNGRIKNVNINDTLYVPELRTNLLSVGKVCDKGFKVIFESNGATVLDKNRKAVLKADRLDSGLYYLRTSALKSSANAEWNDETVEELTSAEIWHRKMGHLNYQDLIKCYQDNAVRGMKIKNCKVNTCCKICASGKMTKSPFPKESTRKSETLEIIHSDICGPMRTESIGKSKYFITFIDDASR